MGVNKEVDSSEQNHLLIELLNLSETKKRDGRKSKDRNRSEEICYRALTYTDSKKLRLQLKLESVMTTSKRGHVIMFIITMR